MVLTKFSSVISIILTGSLWLVVPSWVHAAQDVVPSSVEISPLENNDLATNNRPPEPPRTPPANAPRPGGGLNPENAACNHLNDDLLALIPIDNPVLTASPYPTVLFYVPFGAEDIQFGEFSLLTWPGELTRHYRTQFLLPDSPGIVSVTLPEESTYALVEDQVYRWYLQVYCKDGDGLQPDLVVHGAIQRVALTSERQQQLQSASPEIWYDTLASVADDLQASPDDIQLQSIWHRLLQLINAEDIETASFVGPVLPLE